MPEYVGIPIETDPDRLAEQAFELLRQRITGWVPNDGNLETILTEVHARMASEIRDLASRVPAEIFQYFGNTLLNVFPIDPSPASVNSTWSVKDDAGYTIPAGTHAGIRRAGDELINFYVLNTVVIPPGDTVTGTGEVQLVAVDTGETGSGLSGTVELIDPLDFVTGAVTNGITTGGLDGEPVDVYLNRLTGQLSLQAPRPILPDDFALMAQNVPGIYRSVAIDLLNPTDGTTNNERMVTVAVVDANGETVSSDLKAQVDAYLQAEREVNFVVWVIDPTYTTIDVTCNLTALPGYALPDLKSRVEAALGAYLSPGNWGHQRVGDPRVWLLHKVVRYFELIAIVENVEGVDHLNSLTFGVSGGALATTNVTLTGYAPLPRPGAIVATAVAP